MSKIVYKFKNQAKPKKKKESSDPFMKMCCIVAMNYAQYSVEQLYSEVPTKQVKLMYKEANRRRAETLLLLNGIINGPNAQDKSKKEYKEIINSLVEELGI